ncbi:MAG TPA: aminotransferase class V-fold PLP-dependent enzyme, partial [Pirellulales bacterium]|nr:aminotransferase class V-fold PLP-dependent enzyme [Pirellulales bacterium]
MKNSSDPFLRVYLDQAATSWPKPEGVYAAVDRYQRELGAPAARGVYAEALAVQEQVARARAAVAELLGAGDPRQVVFCYSGTDALNQAIAGVLQPGAHVVTTVVEHNSVLRPLRALEDAGRIAVTRVGCDAEGIVDPVEIARAWRSETQLAIVAHASNVTGAIQPVAAIGRIAHARNGLLLVDAAQTLGELPLDVRALEIDLLAAPGHKGLLGPLGTGVLYLRAGLELEPLRRGGTGSRSESDRQPDELPDRFEAGNLNVPGIFGLAAGLEYLRQQTIERIRARSLALTRRLLDGLSGIDGVRIYGPRQCEARVGIASIRVEGYDPQELAMLLDSAYRVQCRAGLHCAPLMHQHLGTLHEGGTLRLSLGCFNTEADINAALAAISGVASAALP